MTSSVIYLTLTPHDPIIARDGRPFGAGLRMKSLDWPYPSVLAGSVRTALGKMNGGNFDPASIAALKAVKVHGPLPLLDGHLYFPAPKDILVRDSGGRCDETYAIRPAELSSDGEGCDLSPNGLQPPMLSYRAKEEFKPAPIAPFWSVDSMAAWLVNADGLMFQSPDVTEDVTTRPAGLDLPRKESRFHTAINPERGVAEEKLFYETTGLDLALKNRHEMMEIAARIEAADAYGKSGFGTFSPFGGERRLSYWRSDKKPPAGWECPEKVKNVLQSATLIRMVLATPAIFAHGWLPKWIIDKGTLTGTPPCAPKSLSLTLVSACVERWKPLSGFSLEKGDEGRRSKPLRRVVPAGSVYFFRLGSGNASDLATCWLRPVSDDPRDQDDGFGLALWGIWDYERKSAEKEQKKE